MQKIQGTTPAGNKPRILSMWMGEAEPRLHFWIHLPGDTSGWEIRVDAADLVRALAVLTEETAPAPDVAEPAPRHTAPVLESDGGLAKFFQRPLCRQALDRYHAFTEEKYWTISNKFELYQQAHRAFESTLPFDQRREAFRAIYQNLKSYWQVFRNARSIWSADDVFGAVVDGGAACARAGGLTLLNLSHEQLRESVYPLLAIMREIKQNRLGGFPTMAVSKFLHFFNPALFPIFDNAIIYNEVLKVFGNDFQDYGRKTGFGDWPEEEDYYGVYMLWAGELVRSGGTAFMGEFTAWFAERVKGQADPERILEQAPRYYAAAFEFVAIGAAKLIQDNNA